MKRVTVGKSRRVSRQRSKSKSWKVLKFVSRAKRVVKLSVLAVFAVGIAILLVFGYSFYNFLRSSFASSFTSYSTSLSEGEPFAISFIEIEDIDEPGSRIKSLFLVVGSANDNKVQVYTVPTGLEATLPRRFGVAKIERAYALGELIENKKGTELTNKLLERIFARKVDRYILTDTEGLERFIKLVQVERIQDAPKLVWFSNLKNLYPALLTFKENARSNLSLTDLFFLGKFARGLTKDSFEQYEISRNDLAEFYNLDKRLKEILANEQIVAEHKRVMVLNGTGISKLGSFIARFVENSGGSVVTIDNAPRIYDKSFVVASETSSITLETLRRQLGIYDLLEPEDVSDLSLITAFEADIAIVIGIDYINAL
ncbi:LCP family protein [candidate division WWE3 bacterium]|nr:LCP family protein [candidate division WWE3 bacterium]